MALDYLLDNRHGDGGHIIIHCGPPGWRTTQQHIEALLALGIGPRNVQGNYVRIPPRKVAVVLAALESVLAPVSATWTAQHGYTHEWPD